MNTFQNTENQLYKTYKKAQLNSLFTLNLTLSNKKKLLKMGVKNGIETMKQNKNEVKTPDISQIKILF
ncbi:MAG: hypothetical protein IPH94_16255 [Saprospiraceae bacterium]|nr:hypothetical protein [Saprospiraceae bacterium]MBK8108945.1 hypothetical protein [Saprospiraceae bacterium]MBK9687013.1 hypothetical protein [Saprospiraceae bacterium]MBL0081781.1 hypothetical protein [Saprospiraceae bacterium]